MSRRQTGSARQNGNSGQGGYSGQGDYTIGTRGGRYPGADQDTVLSKKISAILRHTAAKYGLTYRADGYVNMRDMLGIGQGRHFAGFTEADVVRAGKSAVTVRGKAGGRRWGKNADESAAATGQTQGRIIIPEVRRSPLVTRDYDRLRRAERKRRLQRREQQSRLDKEKEARAAASYFGPRTRLPAHPPRSARDTRERAAINKETKTANIDKARSDYEQSRNADKLLDIDIPRLIVPRLAVLSPDDAARARRAVTIGMEQKIEDVWHRIFEAYRNFFRSAFKITDKRDSELQAIIDCGRPIRDFKRRTFNMLKFRARNLCFELATHGLTEFEMLHLIPEIKEGLDQLAGEFNTRADFPKMCSLTSRSETFLETSDFRKALLEQKERMETSADPI